MDPIETLETSQSTAGVGVKPGLGRPRGKKRRWLWLLVVVLLGYGGWRLRGARDAGQAQSSAARGPARAGNPGAAVPVVVATAQRGDLPVYLNGLGTVAAFNTVTVRSRVDGQLIHVAFKEGQYVHEGDLLAEIDPRPFQVQLEQAEGQFARDTAQLHDAKVNYERYVVLYKEGVISKQQLDSQQAQMEQFEGAIKADQGQIDNAKLQLTYSRITAPLSGRVGLRLVDPGPSALPVEDVNGVRRLLGERWAASHPVAPGSSYSGTSLMCVVMYQELPNGSCTPALRSP